MKYRGFLRVWDTKHNVSILVLLVRAHHFASDLFSPGISISLSKTTIQAKEGRKQENKEGKTERRKKQKQTHNKARKKNKGERK
jgi:hypothetical protein